jgi:hypothetical protein
MDDAIVKITSLEEFETKGLKRFKSTVVEYPLYAINIEIQDPVEIGKKFCGPEIALRAMSFLDKFKGEFDVVSFNCEHFCTLCVTDVLFSK